MKALVPNPETVEGSSWPAIAIGAFVAFGGVLFGYDTGTISGILAMDYWRQEFSEGFVDPNGKPGISPSETSTVSILSAGTFFGALASPLLGDNIGRRWGLIASCWVFNLGVILQTAATGLSLFLAGRFFAGLGVGLISALIPLYQSETAPKWIRGAIVGAYQLAITFAWSLVLIVGMLLLPETPRYLIKKDKMESAGVSLGMLRRLPADHPAVLSELADIKTNHEMEMAVGTASYGDLFHGGMSKRMLTGIGLQALQQLTGINFIFYYGTQYFLNSGINNAFIITMITSCINVVSTLPGLVAIDVWGRRPLLLWGAVGMCVSQFIVAMLGTLTTGQDSSTGDILVFNLPAQKASIAFVCLYIFFFASTWGPLAWVVTGEIFPLKFRARGLRVTTASNSKIFFVWFAACFLCITFVYLFVYETKGLSLEVVDEMYNEVPKVHAWRSKRWTPSRTRNLPTNPAEKKSEGNVSEHIENLGDSLGVLPPTITVSEVQT
ncbi:high-affinity glucose transporter RGT2 [Podospora australis]|uniref:High-affinity glucose transporter RGT2 n=1 Tax=Podospora australis TaxID=1536484 RepID=A0AAN6WMY1_9PEZI|nr:high-affinity glucose transporter RGT2 [Podospora australis]